MLAYPLGQWTVYCLVSGLLAAVLMNIPMYVQPEGYRPAFVAAAGLTRRDPSDVETALAVAVHHVTGTAAALLYGGIVAALGAVLPAALLLNGIPAVPPSGRGRGGGAVRLRDDARAPTPRSRHPVLTARTPYGA